MRLTLRAALVLGCVATLSASPVFAAGPTAAGAPAATERAQGVLDTAFAGALAQSKTPGGAAAISREGVLVWSGAAGLADTQTRRPFDARTLTSVASVTKLFTATLVMRMAEQGTLALDAPIARYLDAKIPAADTVTLRNLLSMRSGYNDVEGSETFLARINDPNYAWTYDALFALIEKPHARPGQKFEYCNTNYVILSAIIEKTYPGGVAAAFRDLIARPAGIEDEAFFTREPAAAARFARGYFTLQGKTTDVNAGATDLGVPLNTWGTLWGDGGVASTALGLARFADALFGGRIVTAASLAAMVPAKGTGDYGLGMTRMKLGGRQWIGHLGAFPGYGAMIAHDPARKVTVAVVINGLDGDAFAQQKIGPALVDAYDRSAAALGSGPAARP